MEIADLNLLTMDDVGLSLSNILLGLRNNTGPAAEDMLTFLEKVEEKLELGKLNEKQFEDVAVHLSAWGLAWEKLSERFRLKIEKLNALSVEILEGKKSLTPLEREILLVLKDRVEGQTSGDDQTATGSSGNNSHSNPEATSGSFTSGTFSP